MADVLVVVCDGLKGLPEAIESVWPEAWVQTCLVHLVRASLNLVSYTDGDGPILETSVARPGLQVDTSARSRPPDAQGVHRDRRAVPARAA